MNKRALITGITRQRVVLPAHAGIQYAIDYWIPDNRGVYTRRVRFPE